MSRARSATASMSRVTIPLRFSQLEIASTAGYQTSRQLVQRWCRGTTLFTERNMQVTATWHFSSKFNLRLPTRRLRSMPYRRLRASNPTCANSRQILVAAADLSDELADALLRRRPPNVRAKPNLREDLLRVLQLTGCVC